jgi:hypothetical protein
MPEMVVLVEESVVLVGESVVMEEVVLVGESVVMEEVAVKAALVYSCADYQTPPVGIRRGLALTRLLRKGRREAGP